MYLKAEGEDSSSSAHPQLDMELTETTDNPGTTSETGEPAPGFHGEESEANTGPRRDVCPCQQPSTGRQPSQGC